MAIRIQNQIVIDDDGSFRVGTGTTAERPAAPVAGTLWYNTELISFEAFDGTEWGAIGGSDEFARTLALLAV